MKEVNEDLRRRQTSRLWYRRPLELNPAEQEAAGEADSVIAMSSDTALDPGNVVLGETAKAEDRALFAQEDEYTYFELNVAGMKLRTLNFNDPHVHRSLQVTAQMAWRAFPADMPALTLSATENLQTRLMGPVLNTGIRYRVVDHYNGVVAVEIERLGLPPMRGYCLAADLEAIEQGARPKRSGRQVEWLRSVSERVSQSFGVIDITLGNAASTSQD
jgi:hypothetical protein